MSKKIAFPKSVQKKSFSWIKKYYINGCFYIGKINLYGVWNGYVYKIFVFVEKKFGKK